MTTIERKGRKKEGEFQSTLIRTAETITATTSPMTTMRTAATIPPIPLSLSTRCPPVPGRTAAGGKTYYKHIPRIALEPSIILEIRIAE